MKITNMLLIVAAAGTLVACDKTAPDTAAPDVAAPEAPETPSADDVTDEAGAEYLWTATFTDDNGGHEHSIAPK